MEVGFKQDYLNKVLKAIDELIEGYNSDGLPRCPLCEVCDSDYCRKCPHIFIDNTHCHDLLVKLEYEIGYIRRNPDRYPYITNMQIVRLKRWKKLIKRGDFLCK